MDQHDFDTLNLHDLQDLLSLPSERHTHLLCDEPRDSRQVREDFALYTPRRRINRG